MATIYGTTGSDRRNGTSGSDNIYGWARGNNANSPSGNDILNGNAGSDNLLGGTGNDTLIGGAGNDSLDGGLGFDSLLGGLGNDIYLVDRTSDRIIENSLQGTDTVKASVRWTLGNNLENLIITAPGNMNGSGNSLNNTLTGNAANNTLYGFDGLDLLYGESGNDNLSGGNGNDTSYGGAGNDTLIGILGNDRLYGETGNDTYEVDSTNDSVTEYSDQGTDIVKSSVEWTLGDNLENLTLTGISAINGTGNNLNNTITGNSANNSLYAGGGNDSLYGKVGNDTLIGGLGSDTLFGGTGNDFYVYSTTDTIIEFFNQGYDTVESFISYTLGDNLESLTLTGSSNISGVGNALNNTIIGNTANNVLYGGEGYDQLDGGLGRDTLIGGIGDDFYFNNITDTIVEYFDEGFDGLVSSVSYTLGDNLEYLTLIGSSDISATGNALDNHLFGNSGNNSLYGGDGNDILFSVYGELGRDTLIGGMGNDDYRVDSTIDTITEYFNEGIDIVDSSISYTLGDNLENLSLLNGSGTIGIGNALDNQISANNTNNFLYGEAGNDNLLGGTGDDILNGGTGNDILLGDVYGFGNDTLTGGAGNDTLTGGAGADIFSFQPFQAMDIITDFSVVDDTIQVLAFYFGGGLTTGANITPDQFVIGSAARDANDRFIYNQNTGALFFDADGTGAVEEVQLAFLSTGLAMTYADIFVTS